MSYKIFTKKAYFYIVDNDDNREYSGLSKDVKVFRGLTTSTKFNFTGVDEWVPTKSLDLTDLQDETGAAYTAETFVNFYERYTGLGLVDVSTQSSTSPLVLVKASEPVAETTLSALAVFDAKTFTVTSPTGAAIGQQLTLFSPLGNRVSFFQILNVVGSVITVDSPIDFAYEIGAFATFGNTNMAVDGSVTPRVFGIRNPTAQDINLTVDFTRMILSMELSSAGNLSTFGNIAKLEKGLVCRFNDDYSYNIFNVKDNRELDNIMYDLKFIDAKGPAPEGLSGRFTFEKLGSVIRLKPFEDLLFIVQDDLTTGADITKFEIMLGGAGVTL